MGRVGDALEIVLAHITIASIPVHAFDTLVGSFLARIIIFRSSLSGRIPNGQYAPGDVDLVL
jgi:CBS domain-containing protein